jgi:hypothetical protein
LSALDACAEATGTRRALTRLMRNMERAGRQRGEAATLLTDAVRAVSASPGALACRPAAIARR